MLFHLTEGELKLRETRLLVAKYTQSVAEERVGSGTLKFQACTFSSD